MEMRKIAFDSEHGPMHFRLLYSAFLSRPAEKITKDERRYFAEIQRALESVSIPLGDVADDVEIDARPRRLAGHGSLVLSQRAFDRLVTTVEETAFHPLVSAQVEDLLDYLAGSEKVESSDRHFRVVGDL